MTRSSWRLVAVGTGVTVLICVLAILLLLRLFGESPRGSRVGVTLGVSGRPTIRATLCHGLYVQRAEIEHSGQGARLAWRAVASDGTLTTLPLQGPIPGYAVVGAVQPRSDGKSRSGTSKTTRVSRFEV
jgi:hypothetical protein